MSCNIHFFCLALKKPLVSASQNEHHQPNDDLPTEQPHAPNLAQGKMSPFQNGKLDERLFARECSGVGFLKAGGGRLPVAFLVGEALLHPTLKARLVLRAFLGMFPFGIPT